MKAQIYKKIEPELLKEWTKLWQESPAATHVNSPNWFLSVIDGLKYKEYIIIAVYDRKKLVGIASLVEEKMYGLKIYTVVPNSFVCGVPFLFDTTKTKITKTLINKLVSLGAVYLDNIPESFKDILANIFPANRTTLSSINYYMPFTYKNDGKVMIPQRTRMLKGTQDIEEKFNFKCFTKNSIKALETVFLVDDKSRKQDRGYNTFADEQIVRFYQSLAQHFKGRLEIHILYFENNPIAYEIGFLVGKIYYGSQLSFASKYATYFPGKILLVKLIEELDAKGITTMDMGSGGGMLKSNLTKECISLYQIILSKNIFQSLYFQKI